MQQHSRTAGRWNGHVRLPERLQEEPGCHPSDVLVDIPPVPGEMSLEVQVKNRHTVVGFAELSPRLQTLNQTRREQWRLGVYTLPQYRDAVADASAEILHIKKPTRQETLF